MASVDPARGGRGVEVAHRLAVVLDRLARDPDPHPGDVLDDQGRRDHVAVTREDPRRALGAPLRLDRRDRVLERGQERLGLAVAGVAGSEQSSRVGDVFVGKWDDFGTTHAA